MRRVRSRRRRRRRRHAGRREPAARERTRFIAVGDTGKGNADQRRVAIAMRDVCKQRGCDFVLMLGDNIYDKGVENVTDPQWQTKFEQPLPRHRPAVLRRAR